MTKVFCTVASTEPYVTYAGVQQSNQGHRSTQGLLIRGVAEPAPGVHEAVGAVMIDAEHAGLARKVAPLRTLIWIKG